MMHETENGVWAGNRSEGGAIHDERNFSVNLNKPLPWFGVFALVVIFLTAQSYQAKDQAEVAKQTAWKAETESMMLREHVDSLRMEMSAHGIIPPPLPKCLVENTLCRTPQ